MLALSVVLLNYKGRHFPKDCTLHEKDEKSLHAEGTKNKSGPAFKKTTD